MTLILWLSRRTGLTTLAVQIVLGLAVAVAFTVGWLGFIHHIENQQKARDDAAQRAAIAAHDAADLAAKAQADRQRAGDAQAAAQLQTDLRGSYATLPDASPGAVRRALNCERLRHTAAARSPEFSRLCGPNPGSQAAARP